MQDALWSEKSVILVTGNADRAALNASMAQVIAKKTGHLLIRWRKPISTADDNIDRIQDLLYDEDHRPTLFGYFLKNAIGQVLDNSNGNVSMGVANGSACLYHSVAWDEPTRTAVVLDLIEKGHRKHDKIVELPFPPDFINVKLLDRDRNPVPRRAWPAGDNLATELDGDAVIVPIGLVKSSGEKFFVKFPASDKHPEFTVNFEQHAVDLAMALTIWKAQGSTFDRVILHLEGSTGSPSWGFEHLYVALSRVRASTHLCSLPISLGFNRSRLLDLRPNIATIKWCMDIDANGFWSPAKNKT